MKEIQKIKIKETEEKRKTVADFPDLVREWNYEKNEKGPEKYTFGSHKKVWWKCKEGHEWQAVIKSRTNKNTGCPYCTNQKVLKGYNDFATFHPELTKEWNYEKNDKSPEEYTYGSGKKVWWKCSKGHEWKATIASITCQNTGCPYCASQNFASIPEKIISFYLEKTGFIIKKNYKPIFLNRKELDIYIPKLKLGIEYDGERWHQDIDKDIEKNRLIKELGLKLLRIREPKCPKLEYLDCILIKKLDHKYIYMNNVVRNTIKYINEEYNLNLKIDIDVARDFENIKAYAENGKIINRIHYEKMKAS